MTAAYRCFRCIPPLRSPQKAIFIWHIRRIRYSIRTDKARKSPKISGGHYAHIQKKKSQNKREYELHEDFADEKSGDIADVIISKENLTGILYCIDSLRPACRDVMLLKFYHGYENREIAKMLDITEDAVRKRIERGRRELKILLEKEAEKYEV